MCHKDQQEEAISIICAKYKNHSPVAYDNLCVARKIVEETDKLYQDKLKQKRNVTALSIKKLRNKARQSGLTNARRVFLTEKAAKLLEIDQLYMQTIFEAKHACVDLAIKIAKEITGSYFTNDKEALLSRLEACLDTLPESRGNKILVNPFHYSEICSVLSKPSLSVTSSDDIPPGKARIETSSGSIELDWESIIEEVAGRIRSRLNKALFRSVIDQETR